MPSDTQAAIVELLRIHSLQVNHSRQEAEKLERSQFWRDCFSNVEVNPENGAESGASTGLPVTSDIVEDDRRDINIFVHRPLSQWEYESSGARRPIKHMIDCQPRPLNPAIDDACRHLSAVNTFAQGLLPGLAEYRRNFSKAQDVLHTVQEYEARLRARSDTKRLMYYERELVRSITRHAKNALDVLSHFDKDPIKVLYKAYANGEMVEQHLRQLVSSLDAASVANARSGGGIQAGNIHVTITDDYSDSNRSGSHAAARDDAR